MAVVYHWKHGWIPLDHQAALSKAKGDHAAAAKMMSDAPHATGIKSRQDVAKAVLDLPNIPHSSDRASAKGEILQAADHHGAHDLVPKSWGSRGLTSVGPTARVSASDVQAGDVVHVAGLGGKTRRLRVDKAFAPKSDGTVNVNATYLDTGKSAELTLQGDKQHTVERNR